MAEMAGLALSIPGVLDILIKTCLEGYQFLRTARSTHEAFEAHRYQFCIEHQRLQDLTRDISYKLQRGTLGVDDVRFLLISSTLIRIAQMFADFRGLECHYGVAPVRDGKSTKEKKLKRRKWFRRVLGLEEDRKDEKVDDEALKIVLDITDLQLDGNLEMATLRTLEPRLKSVINTFSKLKWALLDAEKVQGLIVKLQQYNGNMEKLVEGHDKEQKIERMTAVATTVKENHHFMVPFPKNDDFIGESHITSWFKAYEKERTTAGKSEHTGHLRLALCGLGGIGKTQDVLNYIYAQQNQRPIFWIHADSIPQFEADYKNLGTHAKIPGLDINDPTQNTGLLVKAWLESPNSGDWILIIDNADNKLNFYPETKHTETQNTESNDIHTGIAEFIPRGSKGTIILTTRDREVAKCLSIPDHHIIQKPEFSSEEAVKLFCQHYSNPDDTADTAALSQLLQELQYLPLAIVQVAVYLDSNRSITINRYLELFRNTKQSQNRLLSNLSTPQLQGYQKNPWRTSKTQNEETILTTFTISFRQLQQQSSLVDQYLRFLACIDRKYIPHDLLLGIRFRTKPFNTNTNPGDEDDQEEANELTLSEAISQLLNHSLLQPITPDATNPSLKTYEIHSLVHLALRTYLKDNNDLDTALSNTSSTLDKILPMPEYNNWTTWRLYLPHVLTLLGNLNQQQESQEPQEQQSQDTASLLTKAAAYLSSTGNYQSALNLHQRAEHIFSHLLPAEDPRTIAAMQRVGDSLYRCGKFHKAVEIQEIVLGIRQRILGGGHRDTLESMERLAGSYQRLGGRGEEVRRLREAVLWGMRKILGEEHPDTLCAVMSLADTMRVQGTGLEEVVRLEEMVLRVRIKVLGEEHSDTLHSMQRLAITYGEIRTREIEVLNKELAEVKGSGVGEEHPDMVRRMKDLGSAYKLLDGRLKEIQGLEEKVLEVRRRTLGEEHPDTLIIMNNLALTYKRQGREKLKEVEELEERILEIRRRTLGEEHPDTLMSMNNLADTYTQRSPGAKMKEVQKLIEKVVEVRRRTLGDDHRDTVDAIYNLAHTLFKLQRLDEAISLMEEVGGAYSRIYGSDHSYTKEVEEYLERWKYVQKKWNAGAQ